MKVSVVFSIISRVHLDAQALRAIASISDMDPQARRRVMSLISDTELAAHKLGVASGLGPERGQAYVETVATIARQLGKTTAQVSDIIAAQMKV